MGKEIKQKVLSLLIGSTAVWATACSDVAFSPGGDSIAPFEVPDGYMTESFGFNDEDTRAKVDILFVVDNSGSMTDEQVKLGPALTSFLGSLAKIDWQIGITTTDVSTGTYGIRGSLVNFKGTSTNILTKNVSNYATAFANTVVRDELLNCNTDCPSSDERPLEAINYAVSKRNGANAGFFRSDADLATVILSDEDEGSTGSGIAPALVVSNIMAAFGTKKTYTGFGIVIKPGDTACYNNQTSSVGQYATYAYTLAMLTGGLLGSICDNDYGPALASIGQRVREMVKTITLKSTPKPDSVIVRIRPFDPNLTWTLEGKTLTFNTPPKPGTVVDIGYLPL